MKTKPRVLIVLVLLVAPSLFSAEFHVSPSGTEANDGSSAKPFRSIQAVADLARPGDVITVHEGVYRERINPPRTTPYLEPHSIKVAGYHANKPGDDRFYHNIFAGRLANRNRLFTNHIGEYVDASLPVFFEGNLYFRGAAPHALDTSPSLFHEVWPDLTLVQKADGVYFEWISEPEWLATKRRLVTSELLGVAGVSAARFEQADGSPIRVDTDYFRESRNQQNPAPGPFEGPSGRVPLRLWPLR